MINDTQIYYVYMLRCEDNSLYTGITTDWERRISEHLCQGKKCAKYTKSHKVIKIASLWSVKNKSSALKLEKKLKSLCKEKKEEVVKSHVLPFDDIAAEYVDGADTARLNRIEV